MDNKAPDSEIVERLTKTLSVCRTCGHVLMSHLFIDQKKIKHCVDAYVNETGDYKVCDCKLFIPKDNLEFLEWAAKNKEQDK